MNSIQTIVFIGAGNVATHLTEAFRNTGRKIIQIYSRSEVTAHALSERSGIPHTSDLNLISQDADLYIISVADSALPQIDLSLRIGDKLAVHTSGFHPMEAIKNISNNIGVFYPLQTFSKDHPVVYNNIPLCIEANNNDNLALLEDLALSFTADVRQVDSLQRKKIHLAAVFACNFTNHLYGIAEEILRTCDVPFDIMKPLIKQTAQKIIAMDPNEAQTGPARRNDHLVIEQHLQMFDDAEMKAIYKMLSEMIIKKYQLK
jgi:predicted short-subunit dehydrogenase-like oxidoreductase (DUF2520 family)